MPSSTNFYSNSIARGHCGMLVSRTTNVSGPGVKDLNPRVAHDADGVGTVRVSLIAGSAAVMWMSPSA